MKRNAARAQPFPRSAEEAPPAPPPRCKDNVKGVCRLSSGRTAHEAGRRSTPWRARRSQESCTLWRRARRRGDAALRTDVRSVVGAHLPAVAELNGVAPAAVELPANLHPPSRVEEAPTGVPRIPAREVAAPVGAAP